MHLTQISICSWRTSPPHTHLSVAAPVRQGWAWLPALGIATWHKGLHSVVTPHTMSQRHSLKFILAAPPSRRRGGWARPEWHCDPVCQVATPVVGNWAPPRGPGPSLHSECSAAVLSSHLPTLSPVASLLLRARFRVAVQGQRVQQA